VRVFLTGASSGIGAALARHYGARGATLGLLARREAALADVGRASGAPFEAYACDVRDLPAVDAAARDFIARHGVPDLVVANAGISHGTLTEDAADIRTYAEIHEVNVLGMVNTFHPFIEPMRSRGAGTLAGIASVAGFRGLPGAGAYSASKAAAIRYLEALRVEMRPSGVRVVTVCPGYVETGMTARNPYRMPFLLPADEAARRIARAMDAGRRFAVIPWQMAIAGALLGLLPDAIFDRLAARAGRKPRRSG
jgi:short-subunit dehydrogenase